MIHAILAVVLKCKTSSEFESSSGSLFTRHPKCSSQFGNTYISGHYCQSTMICGRFVQAVTFKEKWAILLANTCLRSSVPNRPATSQAACSLAGGPRSVHGLKPPGPARPLMSRTGPAGLAWGCPNLLGAPIFLGRPSFLGRPNFLGHPSFLGSESV